MKKQLAAVLLIAFVFACSSSEKKKEKDRDPSSGPDTTSSAPVVAKNPDKPFESADDLLAGVPADSHFCAGIPGLAVMKSAAGATLTPELFDTAMSALAGKLHLPVSDLKKTLESFDGAVVFGRRNGETVSFGALVHFSKLDTLPPLLEAAKLKKTGARYAFDEGETHLVVELLEKRGLAIVAQDAAFADEIAATLAGKKPSFETNPLYEKHDKQAVWVAVDTAALLPNEPDFAAAGSRVLLTAGLDGKSSKLEVRQLGNKIPRLGAVLAANDHAFAGRMPPGVTSAFLLSTKRAAGKSLRDVLAEITRVLSSTDVAAKLEESLKPASVSLDDLDRALGDEVAVGFITGKGAVPGPELMKNGAVVALVETRDEAVAKRLIDFVAKEAGPGSLPGRLKADLGNGMTARVEVSKGATVIAIGAPAFVNQAADGVVAGKLGLASSELFQNARKRVSASNLSLFLDPEMLKQLSALAQQGSAPTFDIDFDLFLLENPAGLDVRVTGSGSVAIVGVMGALAVYGVRQYLANARAAADRAAPPP